MKKKRNIKHKYLHTFLSLTLLISLFTAGCADKETEALAEAVALREPKAENNTVYSEPAARRNLYQATLYDTYVSPYTEEYSFETSQIFDSYRILPGQQVKKGDVLVQAMGRTLSEEIRETEKNLAKLTESYEKARAEAEESLSAHREELENLEEILENLEAEKPEEYIPGSDNTQIVNPDYSSWQAQYDTWTGERNLAEFHVASEERKLQLKKDLYDLDYNYYRTQINKLSAQKQKEVITSGISGTVVGIGTFLQGERIAAKTPVIAVGDPTRKILNFDYIATRFLNNAKDIYAFINGKSYKISPMESDTAARTLFSIQDENDEIPIGAYAVLVILTDYRKEALSVPAVSLHRENASDFLYVMEEDGSVSTRKVEKGMSDGLYTEILSGVEEGEQVIIPTKTPMSNSSVRLETGDTGTPYNVSCNLYLPIKNAVYNPIENGSVYMEKYTAEIPQYLNKGDCIAKITVESDSMDIVRRETSLQRDKERLADLMADGHTTEEDQIIQMQEDIRLQEEQLAERRADYAATEIISPCSGFLSYLLPCEKGEMIKENTILAYVADTDTVYAAMSLHQENIAACGTVMEIEYYNEAHEKQTGQCRAVTLLPGHLSSGLGGFVLLELDEEVSKNIAVINTTAQTPGLNSQTLTGMKRAINNVVLVPRNAVTDVISDNNIGYVYVLEEDGSVTKTPFLMSPSLSGKGNDYYWAIDGLTEGMEVLCWE